MTIGEVIEMLYSIFNFLVENLGSIFSGLDLGGLTGGNEAEGEANEI